MGMSMTLEEEKAWQAVLDQELANELLASQLAARTEAAQLATYQAQLDANAARPTQAVTNDLLAQQQANAEAQRRAEAEYQAQLEERVNAVTQQSAQNLSDTVKNAVTLLNSFTLPVSVPPDVINPPPITRYTPPTEVNVTNWVGYNSGNVVTQLPTAPTLPDYQSQILQVGVYTPPTETFEPTDAPTYDYSSLAKTAYSTSSLTAPTVTNYSEPPPEPTYELPLVPGEFAITLPEVPVIELPYLQRRTSFAPEAPTIAVDWTDSNYQSALTQQLQAKLLTDVQDPSSIGVNPDIAETLWTRARTRNTAMVQRATQFPTRRMTARGQFVPETALYALRDTATEVGAYRTAALARERILIEAELQQKHFDATLEEVVDYETIMIDLNNELHARMLDVVKTTITLATELYNTEVDKFNAQAKRYATEAKVYQSQLEAMKLEAEIYKAQIEAAKLIGEINKARVERYKALIVGLVELSKVYTARLEVVKALQEGQKLKVEILKAQIAAFAARVQAELYRAEAYATRVETDIAIEEARGSADVAHARAMASRQKAGLMNSVLGATNQAVSAEIGYIAAQVAAKAAIAGSKAEEAAASVKGPQAHAEAAQTAASMAKAAADIEAQGEMAKAQALGSAGQTKAGAGQASVRASVSIANAQAQSSAAIAAGQAAAQKAAAQIGRVSRNTTIANHRTNSNSKSDNTIINSISSSSSSSGL